MTAAVHLDGGEGGRHGLPRRHAVIPVKRGSGTTATLCFGLPNPRGDDQASARRSVSARPWRRCPPPPTTPRWWPWASRCLHQPLGRRGVARRSGRPCPRPLAAARLVHRASGTWRASPASDRRRVAGLAGARRRGARDRRDRPRLRPGASDGCARHRTAARGGARRRDHGEPRPDLPPCPRPGRAAAVLRQGTTERLARRLACRRTRRRPSRAAAAAATGMPPAQVAALLAGPPPTTDVELHTLATALTDLEERVRRS